MLKPRSKGRVVLWIILAALLCTLAGAAAYGYFCWQVPYLEAENTMLQDGKMMIQEQKDGTLVLTWPEGQNVDTYKLEVLTAQGISVFTYETAGQTCVLPDSLARDTEYTLQVSSSANWRDRVRPGNASFAVKTLLSPPRVNNLIWTVDSDADTVTLQFDSRSDTYYNMYLSDGWLTHELETLTEGNAQLAFGEGTKFPLPDYTGKYTVLFDAVRESSDLIFYGHVHAYMQLIREDFLGTKLYLKNNDLGNNAWQLFWNETKGDQYEVQQWDGYDWQTIEVIPKDGVLTYNTGHLPKFRDFSFRVIAVGGQAENIQSEPLNVRTDVAAVYSTIWPQQALDVYADETRTEVLGKVEAAKAYCVLEEKEGLFGIRFGDQVGYIDSNYCMINLPEYMEDLCYYEITNSHHSLYMVHDYEIPEVTDTVIKGYEYVELSDGEYLVPFLYPAAKKLVTAAKLAREEGYVLKIYDSYRPRKATTEIYDKTEKIIGDPIPEWTFKEKKERIEAGLPVEPTEPPTTEPPTTEPTETTAPSEGTDVTDPSVETVPPTTEEIITYEKLMTDNGRYALANFLALGYSNHNLGVALDLTMVNLYTGEEVEMQTAIHDLSWNSEVKLNKEPAKKLRYIMLEADFGPLESEWWHFQDNDAKKELDLVALQQGVSASCWMADDHGWRYRTREGWYYKDCHKEIDGVLYTFDADGYIVVDNAEDQIAETE